MKSISTYQLTIPASTNFLSDVRNFVEVHAKEHGFSDSDIHNVRLAVDEAVTNIIKHAYNYDESKKIDVEIEFNKDELLVSLSDSGKKFELRSLKQPDVQEYAKQKRRGGMGLYLIHTLMDEVEYQRTNGRNEIKMCKQRSNS